MADNALHTGKYSLDVPCDNERSATPDMEPKDCTAYTENVAAVVDSTPDGATAEPMQQMAGGT